MTGPSRFATSTLALALALATLLTLGLTGCSKADESTLIVPTGTTPPLSRADWLEQANAICKDADERVIALTDAGGPVHNGTTPQALEEKRKLVDQITPIADNAVLRLSSITPPAEDQPMADKAIGRIRANLTAAQADPSGQIDPIGSADPELYTFGLYRCFSKGT